MEDTPSFVWANDICHPPATLPLCQHYKVITEIDALGKNVKWLEIYLAVWQALLDRQAYI